MRIRTNFGPKTPNTWIGVRTKVGLPQAEPRMAVRTKVGGAELPRVGDAHASTRAATRRLSAGATL
jgi:hypothetical protein